MILFRELAEVLQRLERTKIGDGSCLFGLCFDRNAARYRQARLPRFDADQTMRTFADARRRVFIDMSQRVGARSVLLVTS
jgi:hypothetical protein